MSISKSALRRRGVTAGACGALVVAALAVAGCGSGSGSSGASGSSGGTTITIGTPNDPTSVDTAAILKWATQVGSQSGGKLTIKVYPSGQLGTDQTEMTAVQQGSQGGFVPTSGDLVNYTQFASVIGLPYIFPGGVSQAASLLASGPVANAIDSNLASHGFKVLAWLSTGDRELITKNPVTEVSQLQGLKIRTEPDPVSEGEYKFVGADVDPIAFSDVYTALATNVVNAFDDPPDVVLTSKFYQVAHNLTENNFIVSEIALVVNAKTFDQLPASDQTLLETTAATMAKQENAAAITAQTQSIAELKSDGMNVHTVDIPQWQAAWAGFDSKTVKSLSASASNFYNLLRQAEGSS